MQTIDRILESVDLSYALFVLGMLGFFLAVYVNQLTRFEGEDAVDPWYVKGSRVVAYVLLAWSYLWVLSFAEKKEWQPWPPVILMMLAMDAILLIRALAIKARVRRSGVKPESPAGAEARLRVVGR